MRWLKFGNRLDSERHTHMYAQTHKSLRYVNVSKYLCQQGKWKHLFFLRFFLLEDVNGGIGLSRLITKILFVSIKRKAKL